jgi:N-acetylmuramoyl-L-alanine amidase
MVVAGTLLICALTLLAFAGGRLFGRVDAPTPTPTVTTVAVTAATPPVDPIPAADAPDASTPDLGLATGRKTAKGAPVPGHRADGTRVVCLDPGHGGPNDRGRQALETSPYYALEEANLVLQTAWDLQARLQRDGIKVAMTRNSDSAVNAGGFDINGDGKTTVSVKDPKERKVAGDLDELQGRINVCNMANSDLMISMHINGFDTPAPRGYETWFTQERPFGDQSHRLATLVYRALQSQLAKIGYRLPADEERGVKPDTKVDNQTEHSVFDHFVLTGPAVEGKVDPSRMPGTVVESLFVSNDGDAAILGSSAGEQAIVTAYELAILQYFNEYPG